MTTTLRQAALIALAIAGLSGLAGCGDDTTPGTDAGPMDVDGGGGDVDGSVESDAGGPGSLADIAAGNPDFSILVAAASRAGLVETLDSGGPFTVFAPTNAAFEASGITQAMIEAMPVETVRAILTYHALSGLVPSSAVMAGPATTVSSFSIILGTTSGVTINGGNAVTGGANVVTADVPASNGVIHIIDRVLLPPTVADLARYAGLTSLVGAVTAADLGGTLSGTGPFTVFAPTNEAFAMLTGPTPPVDLLRTVLLYHVVSGAVDSGSVPAMAPSASPNAYGDNLTLLFNTTAGVKINGGSAAPAMGANVVVADVVGTNGIVHVIDRVLRPMNIPAAATAAGLTGLLGAVTAAADLPMGGGSVAAALSAQAPYTVFAPTNEAFTAAASLMLNTVQTRDVLLFHVLSTTAFPAPVLAADLPTAATSLATLNAANQIAFNPGPPPTVQMQSIVATDIVVTNGVIHLIGGVMIPTTL